MELLDETFDRLSRGGGHRPPLRVRPPDAQRQPGHPLRLGKDEIAIFEGIHALNDDIEAATRRPRACISPPAPTSWRGRSCASRAPGCASPAAPCGTTISAGQTCWKRC
ncbi:hypothetical protein M5E87_08280 [Flavonifractor plautii]|nr:hypothetical protein M5E87_08280 [Flavonifractor plautii]